MLSSFSCRRNAAFIAAGTVRVEVKKAALRK
jgi:hypothetical protein